MIKPAQLQIIDRIFSRRAMVDDAVKGYPWHMLPWTDHEMLGRARRRFEAQLLEISKAAFDEGVVPPGDMQAWDGDVTMQGRRDQRRPVDGDFLDRLFRLPAIS
jgi:hypothetical protein